VSKSTIIVENKRLQVEKTWKQLGAEARIHIYDISTKLNVFRVTLGIGSQYA